MCKNSNVQYAKTPMNKGKSRPKFSKLGTMFFSVNSSELGTMFLVFFLVKLGTINLCLF